VAEIAAPIDRLPFSSDYHSSPTRPLLEQIDLQIKQVTDIAKTIKNGLPKSQADIVDLAVDLIKKGGIPSELREVLDESRYLGVVMSLYHSSCGEHGLVFIVIRGVSYSSWTGASWKGSTEQDQLRQDMTWRWRPHLLCLQSNCISSGPFQRTLLQFIARILF
jgi:hypothetical protein